ncbi:MAG TPA: NUDIX domain-containing protein [Candidatus Desulfofervidus auxilii]|uniref:NUDIX domain-containing protein n=1 Tax=Desulfofervidus auxilii TaxID=1621989 RepID=A0A7C0U2M3_DESA2|nr:NUDIX domain-containing protein [Candidatus Desulfofervidus auxilii]
MRRYPSHPLVGVGAIIFKENSVLLIKRAHPPAQGIWSIPGGLVKLGETLKEAIIREVKEETNLKVEVKELIEIVERILQDKEGKIEYHFIIIDFLCSVLEGNPKAQSDAQAICWQPLDDLDKLKISAELKNIIKKAYTLWQEKSQ